MYMAGMVFLPPRGGFALRHFSGAKLRKISETTPPFNDRNIFFCFQNKKNSQKHLEVSWKVCTFALAIKQLLQ